MLGGAHLTMACPDTLVCRLGDAVGHLHRRLLAADRLGVVVVLDELWALRAHQVWRSACVSLWAWDLGTRRRREVRGFFSSSSSSLLPLLPLLLLLFFFFSSSSSSLLPLLLFFFFSSSSSSKKKKAPRRGGVWGGAPGLK
jgi:hypothetical protein